MNMRPGFLFVLNSLGIGGSETKIIRIANAMANSDVSAQIAYLSPIETARSRIDPTVPVTYLRRRSKYSLGALRKLRTLIADQIQIVIAVNLYPLLYVIPAIKLQRTNVVTAVGLVNTAELVGKERLLGNLYAQFLRRCDNLIFGSVSQQSHWIERYGLSPGKSQVIYNGVDHVYFSPTNGIGTGESLRRDYGIPDDAFVVGSVGRLAPEKSFDLLVTALSRVCAQGRKAYVILIGQGPEKDRLERLAIQEGISERVKFVGLLGDVRPALSVMDVFVLPSNAVETFSNAALEAMAMARPVVLSKMGGAAEMIEHGKSGMLFDVGDVSALTGILETLCDSGDLRRKMGEAGRSRVVNTFGLQKMVEQYRALLPT